MKTVHGVVNSKWDSKSHLYVKLCLMLKRWSDNVVREYKEYYVAVIDLLGFKNTINNETCETICGFYDEIYSNRSITQRYKAKKKEA